MAKFKFIFLALVFWFFSAGLAFASEKPAFVTIVNPVRNRVLWQGISFLEEHVRLLENLKLPSTWLLQYDTLGALEITTPLKERSQDEIGVFLEVSENLATDSEVPYLVGKGEWFRADKVFFSGYEREERQRMADRLFAEFKKIFGFYPKSVGAWYIDAFTLNYLVEKYHVTAVVDCADQYSTDNYQIWGKPWGVPFYPSKFNTLVPAQSRENKLPVVKVQWGLRDPKLGFGRQVSDSTYSLQANDYQGHHELKTDFFEKLLDTYLKTDNQFSQATVGLEVGQEGAFLPEFGRELQVVAEKRDKEGIKILTLSQFADWYREKFPGLSPSHFIGNNDDYWYSSPMVRIGKDSRFYDDEFVEKDLVAADKRQVLYRIAGDTESLTGIRRFKKGLNNLVLGILNLPLPKYYPLPLKFARIDSFNVFGLQIGKTKLLGVKFMPLSVGIFDFPFQALVRFKTWPKINLAARLFTSDSELALEEFLAANHGQPLTVLKKEEISLTKMEELGKMGQKLVLDNSEFQVWQK